MKKFYVQFGMDRHEKNAPSGMTFGQVKQDGNLKALLGFGDNVRALIDGVEMPDSVEVPDGCEVQLETKMNTKALALA